MNINEINEVASAEAMKYIADGYMLEVVGNLCRNNSVILIKGSGNIVDAVMIKVEHIHGTKETNYVDGLAVVSYKYESIDPSNERVLWEDHADEREEVMRLYNIGEYGHGFYVEREEAMAASSKSRDRYSARHISAKKVMDASRMSDNLLEKIRAIRGFKRANKSNATIEKLNGTYRIKFDFTKKELAVDFKYGVRVY